jgi:putative ABC transport system ATP-binding protein
VTAVQLDGVVKRYRGGECEVRAVDAVSLRIAAGELVAVAGPSGSGKTTLLNLMGGLDQPDSGRVWVDGVEVTGLSRSARADLRRRRIGFVFRSHNLVPVLSARENAELVLLLQGVEAHERAARVGELFHYLSLDGVEARRPHQLTAAQQLGVALARATAARPALIVADEPTATLDSRTGAALLDVMQRLNRDRGTTFVFSTHDSMVMERAQRIIHLHDGRVAWDELRQPMAQRGGVALCREGEGRGEGDPINDPGRSDRRA